MNDSTKYNEWFQYKKEEINKEQANEFNRVFGDLMKELNIEPVKTN